MRRGEDSPAPCRSFVRSSLSVDTLGIRFAHPSRKTGCVSSLPLCPFSSLRGSSRDTARFSVQTASEPLRTPFGEPGLGDSSSHAESSILTLRGGIAQSGAGRSRSACRAPVRLTVRNAVSGYGRSTGGRQSDSGRSLGSVPRTESGDGDVEERDSPIQRARQAPPHPAGLSARLPLRSASAVRGVPVCDPVTDGCLCRDR